MGDNRLEPLVLSEAERRTLENWAKRRKTAQGLALQARIVLACADGGPNIAAAAQLGEEAFQVVGEGEVDVPLGGLGVEGVDLGVQVRLAGAQVRHLGAQLVDGQELLGECLGHGGDRGGGLGQLEFEAVPLPGGGVADAGLLEPLASHDVTAYEAWRSREWRAAIVAAIVSPQASGPRAVPVCPLHKGKGAGMSTQRLGLTVIPGAGWRASDVRNVAREAEAAGFDAIFTTEVNNDALATAQLMGSATTHIQIGTWIASIYLRHSYTCAKGASLIADDTGGRFVLGLGVSHQPVNDALTIDMSHAPADLHRYAIEVRNWLDGNGPDTHLPQQPAPVRVPIYIATLSLAAVERAAEIADGIMPTMWSPERVTQSAARADEGRARAPHLPALDITLGLPTFIGDDLGSLRDAARQNLALYTFFPYFQRMWRESGFGVEADQMKKGAGPAALSDRLLDSFCLFGPVTRCQERLAAYRAAGVALPILNPAIGPDAALAVIRAFAR